jgi:hypothetical protein
MIRFDELLDFISFVKDADSFEKKLVELKTREDAIVAATENFNLKDDIATEKAEAAAQLEYAAEIVAQAKVDGEAIKKRIQDVYDKKFVKLQEREVKADQVFADMNAQRATWVSREQSIAAQEKTTNALQLDVSTREAALSIKEAEVEARLEKLRQVMG